MRKLVVGVFLVVAPPAWPNPVTGGVQVAVYPEAMDLVTALSEGLEVDLAESDLHGEYGCYDTLGVRNFNAHIEVGSLETSFTAGTLSATIRLNSVHGENMEIYSEDADWLDACAEFPDLDLETFDFSNGVISMDLSPSISQGALYLGVSGEPSVSGDLDMDLAYVPDDLVLGFFEETLFEFIGEEMAAVIPEMAGDYLDDLVYAGAYKDLSYAVSMVDLEVRRDALDVGVDVGFQWNGDGCEQGSGEAAGGRAVSLQMGDGGGSSFGVGVTEALLGDLFQTAWEEGLLCFDEDRVDALLASFGGVLDIDPGDLRAQARMGSVPEVVLDSDGMHLAIEGLEVQVQTGISGAESEFMFVKADLGALLELGLDQSASSLTLSLHEVTLDLEEFRSDDLISEEDGATERIVNLVESWVATSLSGLVEQMAVYGNLFYAYDLYMRLDRVEMEAGGMRAYASVYAADDPAVDLVAPQLQAWLEGVDRYTASVAWSGTDDRGGELVSSWRLDEGTWSRWSSEEKITLEDLLTGSHVVEIQVRDSWLNVSSSKKVAFEITGEPEEAGGWCGCSSGRHAPWGVLGWSLGLAACVIRRRRVT